KRGEDMLHCVNAHRTFADSRSALDCFEILDLPIDGRLILQIFPLEFDSMIHRRGMQFQRDLVTCMQCGAAKAGSLGNGMLKLRSRHRRLTSRDFVLWPDL